MAHDLNIRPAQIGDIAAVDTLLQRSYPSLLKADYPPSVLVTALPRMVRAQPALLRSGTYYVAEEADGTLVGAGGWTAAIPEQAALAQKGRGNVRHLVTAPDALRRGVGRAIMERVFSEAHAAGMDWLHCMSTRTAEPFYSALGFQRIGDITVPLGPGIAFPAVEMHRSL